MFLGLSAPVVLTFNYLRIQKKIIRKEVKHFLIEETHLEELVLLCFSVRESKEVLKWNHEKEFEYNDEMYDVVKRESKGDSLYFWCWWDHEETKLNRQLDEWLSKALGTHSKHHKQQLRLKQFLQNLYHNRVEHKTPTKENIHIPYPPYVFIIKGAGKAPPLKPPEIAL